jgi:hypothetical protein
MNDEKKDSKSISHETGGEIDLDSSPNDIEWNDAIENLIKEQGEKALAYNWLHTRCEKKYSHLNNYIAIPCIVMSTISGSASIASNQFGDSKYISLGIGAFSILVGVLSTINSYFSWAKRAENHRISALNYSKLYLFISIELSLPREKRMNPRDFIKVIREQIERLGEISPPVADDIISQFRHEFDGKYPNVSKPEITNGLVEIKVYKEPPSTTKEVSTQADPPPTPIKFDLFKSVDPVDENSTNDDNESVDTLKSLSGLSKKMTNKKAPAWK